MKLIKLFRLENKSRASQINAWTRVEANVKNALDKSDDDLYVRVLKKSLRSH